MSSVVVGFWQNLKFKFGFGAGGWGVRESLKIKLPNLVPTNSELDLPPKFEAFEAKQCLISGILDKILELPPN